MLRTKWVTDADDLNVVEVDDYVYRNAYIDQFITSYNQFCVVAGKGMGKTLALKMKRAYLYQLLGESESGGGVIFAPKDTPFLDFVSDFSNLSKNHVKYLADFDNCVKVWKLSIQMSAISYYCEKTNSTEMQELMLQVQEYSKDFVWKNESDVSCMMREILHIPVSKIESFESAFSNKIETLFRSIQSGICFFIDRVDQAFLRCNDKDVWINGQIGLLEAAWDVARINNHVKVFISIRQEAYANCNSPNRESFSGNVTPIKYDDEELHLIIDNLASFYEEDADSYYSFIGFDKILNQATGVVEDSFCYLNRHTLGRPRDLVSICSKLSPEKQKLKEHKEIFRGIVNSTSSRDVVGNVFYQVDILLNSLRGIATRERFLSLIPYNVLTIDELMDICKKLNVGFICNKPYCKECVDERRHPFCELYSLGLLGTIENNRAKGIFEQKFHRPSEEVVFKMGNLPAKSQYYLVHPALKEIVMSYRNQSVGEKFTMLPVTIGHAYEWTETNTEIVEKYKEVYKTIRNVDDVDGEVKKRLLDLIEKNAGSDGLVEKLKKFGSEFTASVASKGLVEATIRFFT